MDAHITRLKLDAPHNLDAARELLRAATRRADMTLTAFAWDIVFTHQRDALTLPGESAVAQHDQAMRRCTRCGRELSDPASLEYGIGPICRGRSNALLARTIPADLNAAATIAKTLRPVIATVPQAGKLLLLATLDQIQIAADSSRPQTDWRHAIRAIEIALSFDLDAKIHQALESLTLALGYVALVALWRDEVIKGKAKLKFDLTRGLLVLDSPSARNATLRDIIKHSGGFYFRRERAFIWPATAHAKVRELLPRHWIGLKDDGVDEALQTAATWQPPAGWQPPTSWRGLMPNLQQRPRPSRPRPQVTITTLDDGALNLRTPYNEGFRQALNNLPQRQRRWTGSVWWIAPDAAAHAQALVAEHFNQEAEFTTNLT